MRNNLNLYQFCIRAYQLPNVVTKDEEFGTSQRIGRGLLNGKLLITNVMNFTFLTQIYIDKTKHINTHATLGEPIIQKFLYK